ncbi:MAG: rod shape-determining protein MreC [Christensenellaceae bacterium]
MRFFKNKPVIITIIVIFILIILMIVTSGSNAVSKGTSVVGDVFVPVQKFFYQISDSVGSFFDGISGSGELAQQKAELSGKVTELQTEISDYDEIKAENERLSKLLDYKQNNPTQELKVAKITGKNPGNWFDVFTIDLGVTDGIQENMAVITADGLVGRVEEVGLNHAKVMGIIDGRSGVSAIMERTRDIGVVKGSIGNDALDVALSMNYLPMGTDIVLGDKIITSGLDGLYPKGIIIGEVSELVDANGGKNVKIKPMVDFRRLEEVMVVVQIKDTVPTQIQTEIAPEATQAPSQEPAQSVPPAEGAGA